MEVSAHRRRGERGEPRHCLPPGERRASRLGTVGGFFDQGSRNARKSTCRGLGSPRLVAYSGHEVTHGCSHLVWARRCALLGVWVGIGWSRCSALIPGYRGSECSQTCPVLRSRVRGPLGTGRISQSLLASSLQVFIPKLGSSIRTRQSLEGSSIGQSLDLTSD